MPLSAHRDADGMPTPGDGYEWSCPFGDDSDDDDSDDDDDDDECYGAARGASGASELSVERALRQKAETEAKRAREELATVRAAALQQRSAPGYDALQAPSQRGRGSRVRVGAADNSLTRVSERDTTRRNRATAPGRLPEKGAARQPNHQLHVTDVDSSHSPTGKPPPIRMERALRTVGRSRRSQTNGGRCWCCRQETGGYLDVLCMVL